MRILHVLDHSLPLHSGYVFRTISILREQRAIGWETFQLTAPKQGPCSRDEETVDGWHFYRTNAPGSGPFGLSGLGLLQQMWATAKRLDGLIPRLRPDILHAHSPVLNALPALWVGRKYDLPVVYELRALWEDGAVDLGTTTERSLRYRLSKALETFALRRADRVTTICEGLRGEIVSRGIAAEKVFVIPNAVDIKAFRPGSPPDENLRERLGLTGATVLGFAGSFYGYEGLDLLLDALPGLLPRLPALKVLLVGGGPQEANLKSQALRLGLNDRVVFTGRVPHGTVDAYYNLIDLLVYPRRSMRLTELVTPLKPLEAMAQGRMLVASDVGGHRELIRDQETGFLFKAGDLASLSSTIKKALSARHRWDQLQANARRFVEQERTWVRSVSRYAEVYAGFAAAVHTPSLSQ